VLLPEHSITEQQAAELLGVSYSTVRRYLSPGCLTRKLKGEWARDSVPAEPGWVCAG
jgi:DeoR/GlpR family transcriptional regulator of sugar metabolism